MIEPWIIWCLAGAGLLVVEMLTPGTFVFACFGLAGLFAALAAFLSDSSSTIWTTFLVSAVILLLLARPAVKRLSRHERRPSNVDALIGREAFVIQSITPHLPGLIKVGGEEWRARADVDITANAVVIIVRIEGSSVIVKPKE